MSNIVEGSLACAFTGAVGGAVAYGLVQGANLEPLEPLVSMTCASVAVVRGAMFADEADMSIVWSVLMVGAGYLGGNMACDRIFADTAKPHVAEAVTDGKTVEQRVVAETPKALSLANRF